MDVIWQDLRYALRGLRNQPGFAILAVATLALGIGATTVMFSVIYNVLIHPFPYVGANRVVAFQIRDSKRPDSGGRSVFQTAEFLDYKEATQVFDEIIASGGDDVLLTTNDGTEELNGCYVSQNLFSFLGVPAQIGRTLTPSDAAPGAPPVFVMAYKMWQKYHNLDPAVLGKQFTLDGVPTTLVGVMPRRFTKLHADVYRPVILDRGDAKIKDWFFMLQGRLKPGVSMQQAEAELNVVAKRVATTYPRYYPSQFVVKVVSWVDNVVGPFRQTLTTLAAAVGLLLLIACSNVANMLLARATVREKEMAVRSALGATRWQLVRQLLIESVLLALIGAAIGWALAAVGIHVLKNAIPDGAIPHEAEIRLNLPVLGFSLAAAFVTAVIFGLAPALQSTRRDLTDSLKDGGKGSTGGFRRGKLRSALIVAEVTLSIVLLIGAGLLINSFIQLQTVDLGFKPDHLLVARVPLPAGQYEDAASKQRFFSQLLDRIQAVPGVVSAATLTSLPPFGGRRSEIDIPGKTHSDNWDSLLSLCSDRYFSTIGVRLLRGRLLTDVEIKNARHVAVVNQAFVTRYFGNEDPIGRPVILKAFSQEKDASATYEIIGVVSDTRNQGIERPGMPETFVPYTVTGQFDRGILVRTSIDPLALTQAVRREIWAQDRNVAITVSTSVEQLLTDYIYATPRFSMLVLGVFASVGLVLVAVGVYSVVAYTVSRQTHEIGIRMALGATTADVMRLVLRMGLGLVGLGTVIGLVVSLVLTRVLTLTNDLFVVSPNDPVTIVGVVVIVLFAGVCACFFPARRATRVDPLVALRRE
jgi:putative ABC transport system permease protein